MVDPFVSRQWPGGERIVSDRQTAVLRAFARQAQRSAKEFFEGHHNRNYVMPLTEEVAALAGEKPGTPVMVRVRRAGVLSRPFRRRR